MAEEQKKKKFNLYRLLNEGNNDKGVEKEAEQKRDLRFFFKLLGRRFSTVVKLNLLWLLANFPLFFYLLARSGYAGKTTTAPSCVLFANLHPLISSGEGNPITAALYGVTGIQGTMFVNTPFTYALYALSALLILTFGLANLGVTYNLRNIVRCEPLFLFSDFRDAIRKNLRQGLLFGIFDGVIVVILLFDLMFYNALMRYIALGILIIYMIMRFYIYLMIPTFDLSLYKIFKNALIFTVLGIKRNIAALVGIMVVLFLNLLLLQIFYPLGLLMPLAITVALCMFIGTYAAWPTVKEIMVDPYDEGSEDDTPKEKPIFTDRG